MSLPSPPSRIVWSRATPLTQSERAAVHEVALTVRDHDWHAIVHVRVDHLEDWHPWRLQLRWDVEGVDSGAAKHTALAHIAGQIASALPGATAHIDDGRRVLALSPDGAVAVDGPEHSAPPPVPPAAVVVPVLPPSASPRLPVPRSAAELADLVQVLHATGPHSALIRVAIPVAMAEGANLLNNVEVGVLADSSMHLLAALVDDRFPIPEGLRSIAVRRWTDGDRLERAAAASVLLALRPRSTPRPPGPPDPRDVITIGDALLRASGVVDDGELDLLLDGDEDALDGDSGDLGDDDIDWEDDLLLDELAPGGPQKHTVHEPVARRTMATVAPLPGLGPPPFPGGEAVVAMLQGEPESQAGAALLLACGAWPVSAVAGIGAVLSTVMRADVPPVVRQCAADALALLGRSDTENTLTEAISNNGPAAIAACHALSLRAAGPGRLALREALGRPALRTAAARALARLDDVGALPALRRAAATTPSCDAVAAARLQLDAGLDPRAVATGPLSRAHGRVGHPSTAADVLALGTAGRIDAWPELLKLSQHSDPELRDAVAECMRRLGLRAATPVLVELALDTDLPTALSAVRALAECGDQRAVPVLRRLAARDDLRGRVALDSLVTGRQLRAPPPDGRLRLRAMSRSLMGPDDQRRIGAAFSEIAVTTRFSAAGLVAEGHVDPDRPDLIVPVVDALNQLAAAMPSLVWSVRDGHGLIRQWSGRWVLSTRRGLPARAAGWFEEALAAPRARAPLTPGVFRRTSPAAGPAASPVPTGEE